LDRREHLKERIIQAKTSRLSKLNQEVFHTVEATKEIIFEKKIE
jgi:hypothetical protein